MVDKIEEMPFTEAKMIRNHPNDDFYNKYSPEILERSQLLIVRHALS